MINMETITSYIKSRPDTSRAEKGFERAELLSILDGVGAFTVFVPTDAAFDALPRELHEGIEEDEDVCDDIFMYHVIQGSYTLEDFKGYIAPGQDEVRVPTAQGEDVVIRSFNDTLSVNGMSITEPDIDCSNGTVHIVEGVLRPPSLLPRSAEAGTPRFEVMSSEKGVRFRLRLSSGEVVAVSKGYVSRSECLNDIETIRHELLKAEVIEVDENEEG